MKTKHIFNNLFPLGLICLILFGGGTLVIAGCAVAFLILSEVEEANLPWFVLALYGILGIAMTYWAIRGTRVIIERLASWLTIKEDAIVWHCPLYRSIKMNKDECIHIGIDDMNDHRGGVPILRGDEYAFIYISTTPLPDKYHHKIDTAKCKKGFIRMPYSDKLAKALVEWLPKEKSNQVRAFYCKMQANSQILYQAKKQQRKKKK